MRLLKSTIHPDVKGLSGNSFNRKAARAVVLKGDNILLLYTRRYHDYSLPGGGIDPGEDNIAGLIRELKEETGAQNIHNIREFGLYEEFRPWYKDDFDLVHMQSYCYLCDVDDELSAPSMEHYEINNGMSAVWINIHQAIEHNEDTMAHSHKQGLSIARETFLLKLIVAQLMPVIA
jgi:8-oxo-dGTP pyrophosphatase MutT (NUDIX family)